jgi:hypothetical protein
MKKQPSILFMDEKGAIRGIVWALSIIYITMGIQ